MSTPSTKPNPSWDEVSSFVNSSRDELLTLGKQKYQLLVLDEYLAWALSAIKNQQQAAEAKSASNTAASGDFKSKALELTATYALIARYRLEILKLGKILAIKSEPYKELSSKKVSFSERNALKKYQNYEHAKHDGTFEART